MNRRSFFRGLFCSAVSTVVMRSWSPSSIPGGKVFEQVHVEASTRVLVQLHSYWEAQLRADQAIGTVIALLDDDLELGDNVVLGGQHMGRVVQVDRGGR